MSKRSHSDSGESSDKRQRLSSDEPDVLETKESEALVEQVDGDDTKCRTGCIYLITNLINGKVYVGQTLNYKDRMKKHEKSGKNPKYYFPYAISKHGWENFTKEILIDDVPEEDLDNLEINYIAFYDSFNREKGYNCTKGGGGASGFKCTEEQLKKRVKANTKNHTVEGGGCISFITSKGKWEVAGSEINGGKKNFIGSYLTKKKAEEALGEYNTTGQRILSDIVQRRNGTGSIFKRKWGKYRAVYKGKYVGTFDTEGEANDILEKYANGTNVSTFKKKRGSIWKRGKRFRAAYKNKKIGTFASEEEADQALKIHIENL